MIIYKAIIILFAAYIMEHLYASQDVTSLFDLRFFLFVARSSESILYASEDASSLFDMLSFLFIAGSSSFFFDLYIRSRLLKVIKGPKII